MARELYVPSSVEEWGQYFTNRANTYELSGHGGGSNLDWFNELVWKRDSSVFPQGKVVPYSMMVQAILLHWSELEAVTREAYESNPIHSVAQMAFDIGQKSKRSMNPYLRSYYQRLWSESPRPHTKSLRFMAICSNGELTISPTEIGLLFSQEGWGLVVCQLALQIQCTNLAVDMLTELISSRREEVDIWRLKYLVDLGYPKDSALKIALQLYPEEVKKYEFINEWR